MDHACLTNGTARRHERGVSMMPRMGVFDEYAVKWLTYLLDAKTEEEQPGS